MSCFSGIFLYSLFLSFAFSEQYICNSVNLDNPNGVETTTYTRSVYNEGSYEYFESNTTTHNHNFKNLILTETDNYITMVYFIGGPVANLLTTFINKENNTLYERFNSIDPNFDSDKTTAECEVRF
tara:strand:- start:66 stop:443 length:378 start_codon:yes stop_codon:yes gene_type:complete